MEGSGQDSGVVVWRTHDLTRTNSHRGVIPNGSGEIELNSAPSALRTGMNWGLSPSLKKDLAANWPISRPEDSDDFTHYTCTREVLRCAVLGLWWVSPVAEEVRCATLSGM